MRTRPAEFGLFYAYRETGKRTDVMKRTVALQTGLQTHLK